MSKPRYTLYHYEGNRYRAFSDGAFADWPRPGGARGEGEAGRYVEVARVDAANLDEVYVLTQHHDGGPWTDSAFVTLPLEDVGLVAAAREGESGVNSSVVLRRRSTSVGDVVVDTADGSAYGVASVGFRRLGGAVGEGA